MNMRSRSLRRRRGARQFRGARAFAGLSLALRACWNRSMRSSRLRLAAGVSLVLGLMAAVLVYAPASLAAPRQVPERAAGMQVSPPPPPARAQWTDPSGAVFVVQLTPAQATSQPNPLRAVLAPPNFSFTLANGDTVVGNVAIQGPDASGMDLQNTDTTSATGSVCRTGALMSSAPYAAGNQRQPTTQHVVDFVLQAHFDPDGLVAYAQLVYADPTRGTPADAGIYRTLCAGGWSIVPALTQKVPTLHIGTVASGCPSVTSPCQQPLNTAIQRVQTIEGDILAGDWPKVYGETTGLITGQYTAPDFATAMQAQVSSAGKVVSLSPMTTPPQVQFGTVGQPFFSVQQTATISKGGQTSTRQITSYFLLEHGQWDFWFSA